MHLTLMCAHAQAHDEENACHVGDIVRLDISRYLSVKAEFSIPVNFQWQTERTYKQRIHLI